MPATDTTSTNSSPNTLSSIKRSKPLKYAYEKEIVLYAHHKKLDYFSTECIYSPEAFRGTARTLIKDLERIRPSSILDIVRSGEDMARLCPGYVESSCGGKCSTESTTRKESDTIEEPDDVGGCGSTKGQGDEMRRVDEMLARKEHHLELDVETESILTPSSTKAIRKPKTGGKKPRKEPTKQTLGKCVKCGYMSSQSMCKACLLLEGLNRNRPKTDITLLNGSEHGHEIDINEMERAGKVQELSQSLANLSTVPG
jgi:cytoplasmic tRNA 2-thiolation protein 1